ncbi:hypothetical protein F8144_41650 [Streptomyces triticiradicis]|uniref:Uncharacterized protein n=1 Tax=Streptomyces triticiradicis TaxID=2651189 RepID=A0A7J5D2D3_9ACTN|nr:hypothetical protein F8144_41650 [Streptomyces triticiradicis]
MRRSISRSCGQQAFFEGRAHALTTPGGVSAGQVRYDNLTRAWPLPSIPLTSPASRLALWSVAGLRGRR